MEPVLTLTAVSLALIYAALMTLYGLGWRRLPPWNPLADFHPDTRVTVLIPARNEAWNIGACLQSILSGDYPRELLEIIVVDDHSNDGTAQVVRTFIDGHAPVRLLSLADFMSAEGAAGAHKKKALEAGVRAAGGTLIVTTDADCTAGPRWLSLIVSVFQAQPRVQLLTAPVNFHRETNLLQRFQSLDFLGLMGITGAGIHFRFQRMGNGANLAYRKSVFTEAGGYAGHADRASGDDMFLIQRVAARYPGGVFFLKNQAATVFTPAQPTIRAFLQQRLRWGTKNAALPEWPIRLALGAVFLLCWNIVLQLLICPWSPAVRGALLFQLAVKAAADFLFLRMMCGYFGRRDLLRSFWPSFLLHTFYIALVGTGSLFFQKFEWKGRRVR